MVVQTGPQNGHQQRRRVAKHIACGKIHRDIWDSCSGTYPSITLSQKLGIADQIAGKTRKIRGLPSGEPVAAVVARGEAEIGFQQVSELIHVPGNYRLSE